MFQKSPRIATVISLFALVTWLLHLDDKDWLPAHVGCVATSLENEHNQVISVQFYFFIILRVCLESILFFLMLSSHQLCLLHNLPNLCVTQRQIQIRDFSTASASLQYPPIEPANITRTLLVFGARFQVMSINTVNMVTRTWKLVTKANSSAQIMTRNLSRRCRS